ncbi:cupredoxin domain-containing protein [Rhodoferax mekongensis]|uniref:Cupredoxin family protein n=1 Tax=Rhodoferax mekongensis TaxID=3068341 RepID=A0ABZ0B090_9BURK|nr:cupredoxin family protein [Rhodoferax sp. TBRC 17307]WNO05323.1 cupredoxin family protein [Rhodoferax sp. TBRC 17307]
MKNTIKLIAAGAVLAGAGASFASGSHAGGHGHGTEAIGKPGVAAKVTRTVQIDMTDNMRFTPDTLTVRRGETVRFVVKNSGKIKHEFNLGTEKDLKEHYELMKKFPEMEHDEPNIASVEPGQTGEVIWQFTKAGTVNFACLHPGHFDAGMKGTVKVGAK